MRKILMSYYPAFIPIIKLLVQVPETEIHCLHADFAKQLNDLDIPAFSLGQKLSHDVRGQAFTEAARILARVAAGGYSVKTLPPASADFMQHGITGFLYPRLSEMATVALVIDDLKPDLAIIHNDVEGATKVVAQWCKSHNTPCLHIPHAVYVDGPGRGAVGTDIHDVVIASDIAVAGSYQEEWYGERGGKTRITGLPQFDRLFNLNIPREKARQLLGLDTNRPVVVYASSWRQDTNLLGCHNGIEEAYTHFLTAAKSLPGIQYMVKLHPSSNQELSNWHVNEAKRIGLDCLVTPHHLDIIMQAADLLIAYGQSGVLTEAAHLPRLHLTSIDGFADDQEVNTITDSVEDITRAIATAMSKEPVDARAFAYKYCGFVDGKAYQRIAQYAEELLTRKD